MFRWLRGGPGAAKKVLLAALPLVVAAALLLTDADDPAGGPGRIEATQNVATPLLQGAPEALASLRPATPSGAQTGAPAPAGGDPAPATAATPAAPAGATVRPSETAPAAQPPRAAGISTPLVGGGPDMSDTALSAPEDAAPPPAATSVGPTTTSTAPPSTSVADAPTTSSTTTSAPSTTTTTTTAVAVPAPPAVTAGESRMASVEAEVVPLTNRDRAGQGLGALSRNACLDSVASRYAEQMARSGVLAHNPGAGAAVVGCRPNATWGDNVGTAEPCDTALMEERWMASPSHRRNILTGAFTLIGVGAWTDKDGGCWVQVLFSS